MLLVAVTLAPSPIHGLGVFAAEPITRGQAVWRFTPGFDLDLDPRALDVLTDLQRTRLLYYGYIDLRLKRFILCCDEARFLNHSPVPTLAGDRSADRHGVDRATRDLAVGDELTVDYEHLDGFSPVA